MLIANATFVNSTAMICPLPLLTQTQQIAFDVAVTINGVRWSTATQSMAIHVITRYSNDKYFSFSNAKQCPIGYHCKHDMNIQSRQCLPGQFVLDRKCTDCVPPFYCPNGIDIMSCPDGKICHKFSMDSPIYDCPPSMICEMNTISVAHTTDTKHNNTFWFHLWNDTLILRGKYQNISNYSVSAECISISYEYESNSNSVDCIAVSDTCHNLTITANQSDIITTAVRIYWNLNLVLSSRLLSVDADADGYQSFSFAFCRPNQFFPMHALPFYESNFPIYHDNKSWSYSLSNASFKTFDFDEFITGSSHPCFLGFFCTEKAMMPFDAKRCPFGSYCPSEEKSEMVLCPEGAQCPFLAMTHYEICRAGSYNEWNARRECAVCPLGSVCPVPFMVTPYTCPAGSVCDAPQLISPERCPAGHWCDVGTDFNLTLPYKCPFGTYCDIGGATNPKQMYLPMHYNHSFSYSSIATYPIYNYTALLDITSSLLYPAVCPLGFICSNATVNLFINNASWCSYGAYCNGTNQYIADPGYFVELHQSFMQKPCAPRSFTPDFGSNICSVTPSGFMNPKANATYSDSCNKGYYRNNDVAVFCIGCGNGYWSPHSRLSDETLCEKCPAGRVCGMTGSYNMSATSPCLEGYVCDYGTFVETQFDAPCPRGFACGFETTPLTQYDNPCPRGYYCNVGTALSSQFNQRCPRYYYCPYGAFTHDSWLRLLPDPFERGIWSLFSQSNYVSNIQTTCQPIHGNQSMARSECGDYLHVIALPQHTVTNYTRINHRCPFGTTTPTNKGAYNDCRPMLNHLVLARVNALHLENIQYANNKTYSVVIHPFHVFHFHFEFEFESNIIEHNVNYSLVLYNQTDSDSNQLILSENLLHNVNSDVTFTLSTSIALEFNLSIEILHGRTLFLLSNFSNCVRVHKTSPSRNEIGTKNAFFAFIDEWESEVELPLNLPKHSYFISHSPSRVHDLHNEPFTSIRTVSATRKSKARYWLLPYVPFFSNCLDFGSYLYFNDLFETQKYCSLVDTRDTVPIKSFAMFTQPKSDICRLLLSCAYEEDLSFGGTKKIWFSHLSISQLFYMIASPISADKYNALKANRHLMDAMDESEKLAVTVSRDDERGNWNLQSDIPRDIVFNIEYHQMNKEEKRIISASILLSNFSSWSDGNQYRLNINWNPMTYYDLINHFAYDIDIYLVLFILIAALQMAIYWIILTLHFISRRYLLTIEITKFCSKLFEPLTISTAFVMPGIIILLLLIKLLFCSKYVSSVAGYFGEYAITWLDRIPYTFTATWIIDDDFNNISLIATGGRVGIAFIAISCFILYHSMFIIMPHKQWKEQQRDVTDGLDYFESVLSQTTTKIKTKRSMIWKRTYWIFHAVITVVLSTVIVELSLSPIFETQFYPIFVAIKLSQLIFNRIFTDSLKEDLLISPFTLSLESAVFAATLSAPDFITFVLGHFIEIFITILEGLYWEPVIDWCLSLSLSAPAPHDSKSKSELESISSVVGVTSSHIERFIASIICILFIFILIVFRDETALAPSYGIKAREMLFYELFAVIMIVPTVLSSVVMMNIQGFMYGWNVFNYLEYCQYRYSHRITRWVGNNPYSDLSIDTTSRTTHDLCFSSQYYLVLLFSGCGLLFGLIAIQSFIRHSYSPFGDILFFPIFLFVLFLCHLLLKIHLFFANFCQIYVLKYHYEPQETPEAPDIDYLTPLQRINREKAQYKKEYHQINTPSIVTQHFRSEFLKYNRSFIGDHIHSIVSTKMIKKYSNVSIIELAKVLGLTRTDDIADASDDDEKDSDIIISMHDSAIAVAKYVLSIAKIRRLFKSQLNEHVRHTLDLTQCSLCNKMKTDINIHFDVISVDVALERFRREYIATQRINPLHPTLLPWDKERTESQLIMKDWLQFMTTDIGYEILCDDCFDDTVEDKKRISQMQIQSYSFTQTTKEIATLFLKLAKQNISQKHIRNEDAISVSTISTASDVEDETKTIVHQTVISSDSDSDSDSNRSLSVLSLSLSLSTTDSSSLVVPQSYPDLPHIINENVSDLVRAWCWIATLTYDKHNQ